VPALAGIPVLHRQYASALAIVTGHRCSPPEITMWAAWLHQGGTLVILMGMSRLEQIVGALQQAGLPADVPIAVTMAGSTPQEKTVTGTLATIVEAARDLSAPAVLVLGRVVALREALLPVMPAAYVTSLRRV
jgi:siroheme synthase